MAFSFLFTSLLFFYLKSDIIKVENNFITKKVLIMSEG